jgi:large subunit ribosomal protein L32
MAVPKGKVSKARRNSRKANWKLSSPSIVECPHCHELTVPHRVCKNCGYYDGEQKVAVEKESKAN